MGITMGNNGNHLGNLYDIFTCLYYPLPTAMDLEFKQPSTTFYVRYVAARLQGLLVCQTIVNPMIYQWFLSPPSFAWQVRQRSPPGRALEEVDLHQQNESYVSPPPLRCGSPAWNIRTG